MASSEDFFITSDSVYPLTEEDHHHSELLIKSFDAMARTTYQSIYVLDFENKNFLYVSDNPLFLCGHTSEEVKELGYPFFMNHIPLAEQEMLREISQTGINFINKLPRDERTFYTIFCDFHLVSDKKKILVHHKFTPLFLTKEGHIRLAVCTVSLSSHRRAGHIEIHKSGIAPYWKYSLETHRWKEHQGIILNEKEIRILFMSAQGNTMNEMADKLCMALDTIKSHKRKLFEKLNVQNITKAISFATNYKLL